MKPTQVHATVRISRKQLHTPGEKVQVFAAVLTALTDNDLYTGDQEFIWRQVGLWKGFKVSA